MRSDTGMRIVVAIPLAVAAVLLVAAGGWVLAVGLVVVGGICLHEFYDLVEPRKPVRAAGFLMLVASLAAAQAGGLQAVFLVSWAAIPVTFALIVARPNMGDSGDSVFVTVFGVWWIALALAQALLLRGLEHGGGVLLIALICVFATDIGAYFGGRSFGQRPLAPRLSPRKTVEGLMVGAACGVVAAVASTLYAEWLDLGSALAIGLVVAALAPAGDLFESMLKRDAGAKDTARLLGPHGGLLDRLDGVIFAVVGAYWVWLAIA